ncbi:hypothetical protein DRH29_04490 [candidate division Kazan bacterium]|uniref:Uncharacterized protein n=1 Tax=candidate division Kazan bacterium TaxID=2202143 RepID=A0A420ZBL2_UNCK3|nr:MAG: hypothetical protein DRH29_04490 [candidate division Kazan bacterium]
MPRTLKIRYMDGKEEAFTSKLCFWVINDASRFVYIVYPQVVLRIPFEAIRTIEEERERKKKVGQ